MAKLNRVLSAFFLLILISSCDNDKTLNFTLKGRVKGLKKGIVYLQKDGDSTIINLDSMVIQGQPEFILKTNLNEPILLYLKLFKNDGEEHFIPFFADNGTTEISTSLKHFNFDAQIKGSKQQDLLENYLNVMSRYKNQNLDLIEASFLAQKENDSIAVDALMKRSKNLLNRKYSYTIQFAMNNKDSEVSPYLVLYEIPSANPVYIDSIYNGLTEEIKQSFYGKKLGEMIEKRKIEN